MTHTYAVLDVSQATYDEIHGRLTRADYRHALDDELGHIDMHGIALAVEAKRACDAAGLSRSSADRLLIAGLLLMGSMGAWTTLTTLWTLVTR